MKNLEITLKVLNFLKEQKKVIQMQDILKLHLNLINAKQIIKLRIKIDLKNLLKDKKEYQ